MRSYDDSRFGVQKYIGFAATSSLAGTSAATELQRMTVMEACTVNDWNLSVVTGGTSAGRSVLLGYSLAGTGAFTAIGTAALGTLADSTVLDAACTATNLSNGDDIILQVLGTAAGAYVVRPYVIVSETFVNA